MSKKIDLTGQKFGKLTVISNIEIKTGKDYSWLCKCDCGEYTEKRGDRLRSGKTKSCGCLRRDWGLNSILNIIQKEIFIDGTNIHRIKSKKLPTNNTSGCKGVSWDKLNGKWRVYITFKKKRYQLGEFENFNDAVKIRKEAEKRIFGEFLEWYENEYKNKHAI